MTNPTPWRERLGLWRSLLMYYGIPGRQAKMRRFYRAFIQSGDLCFDIGAHVGNRLAAWRSLDARMVAVEPQPLLMDTLVKRYGRDPSITLVSDAVGASAGEASLYISSRTPTVTTLSPDWMQQVKQDASFRSVEWDREIRVPVTTLDALIEQHGEPVFCKIDVEGFELDVLRGLSTPLRALSFEYIPAAIQSALDCIDRLETLGRYEYNLAPGESHRLSSARWQTPAEMANLLRSISDGSGDVYARRL